MSERERHSSFPRVGCMLCTSREYSLCACACAARLPSLAFPPPPPQSFRDPARLEPWSCFDAVGRTRRTPACLVVFLVFWPLMPAAVFDFLTCRGGGVSVFCLFFFSSLLFSPPRAWRGLAWSGSLLPLFQPILPHHPHRLSPTVFLPRPFQTASTIVAAPLVLRLARLARRGTNKPPILPPRSSAPLFPPLPLVPPLLPSCRLRPRPRPPPCHPRAFLPH